MYRHPGRRRRVFIVALGTALGLILAGAPAARGQTPAAPAPSTGVPVTPCPAQIDAGPGGAPATPAIPRSVALPPVTLPSAAAVYGTTQPSAASVTFALAPAGFTCAATLGADGSYYIELTAPGAATPSISYVYSAGGIGINQSSACGYFPALQIPPADGGTLCDMPPKGEIVRPITVASDFGLLAATTVDRPGMLPSSADPSHGRDESVGVVLADEGGGYQAASCILPPGQRQLCLAGLGLFTDQSIAAQAGATAVARLHDAISGLSTADAAGGDCPAALDATMEREINKSDDSPIPVPDDSIDTPLAVQAVVDVSFVPGEATVCDTGLTAALRTPDGFDGGLLSLSAKVAGQSVRGPFTYSADATAWTSAPGSPAGQQLKTEFDPLSVDAAIDPRLRFEFTTDGSDSEAEPVLDIAHITISADREDVTLVGPSGPLLRVGLGPSLELSVGIKKKDAEEAVKDAESAGEDEASAEADVADEISGDAAAGIDEAASEFDGLDISGEVIQALFDQLQAGLLDALEADTVLIAFVPPDADAPASEATPDDVTADEVTADDAAALDTEAAGAAVEVDGAEALTDLFVLFLF